MRTKYCRKYIEEYLRKNEKVEMRQKERDQDEMTQDQNRRCQEMSQDEKRSYEMRQQH